MDPTRSTLLLRVKDRNDTGAWKQFYDLYAPFLYRYARGRGLARDDACEVRDQSMAVVFEHIGRFRYDRGRGTFKAWLRKIADSRIGDMLRRRRVRRIETTALNALAHPAPSVEELWERCWKLHHLCYSLERVRPLVSEASYTAFELLVFEELPVVEVSRRLGINRNQVYKAKSRVLHLVRETLEDLGHEEG
jgi:RNA polymerase sigma-70 factor (ECF subfamily)